MKPSSGAEFSVKLVFMNDNTVANQAEEAFRAVLMPYRSLGSVGFLVLMCAVGLVSLAAGALLLAMGAWPVFGFIALDVLLIYVAFRLSYRSGRQYETVELTRDLLTLNRFHPSGRCESFQFNPYWVRVQLHEGRHGRADLCLASHGRRLSIGRFLTDDEKREFAEALKGALLAARGGPRI
jgi:uncharacterized membrane protein